MVLPVLLVVLMVILVVLLLDVLLLTLLVVLDMIVRRVTSDRVWDWHRRIVRQYRYRSDRVV